MSANDNIATVPPPPVAAAPVIEAPSGKDRGDENFPVGSFLIAPRLRPHIHAFYAFARNGDDIADSSVFSADQKIERLDIMEEVLLGKRDDGSPSAQKLRESLEETKISPIHSQELLRAFRQDAVKNRYENFAELADYCRYSAAPVGRHVLALHGESEMTWPSNDALCASLQILNHLQDAAADLRNMDRCYIPQDMLAAAGAATDDLARSEMFPALRGVFDDLLRRVTALNQLAGGLPGNVKSRRLRVETAVIVNLARRLTAKLQAGDPLATRVKLSKPDFFAATMAALPRLL